MNDARVFKVLDTFQKGVRYFYLTMSLIFIYSFVMGTVDDIDKWIEPVILVISRVELGLVAFFLGVRVAITSFKTIEGDLLGTDINNLLRFWEWCEDKVKDLLIYNGALGVLLISLHM